MSIHRLVYREPTRSVEAGVADHLTSLEQKNIDPFCDSNEFYL